jgi:hypothetical protein
MNYEEDIAIDPNNLEEEWFKQPSLCYEYAKAFREAQEKYKDVKSRLILDIKLNPGKYIDSEDPKDLKVTDKIIEAILFQQEEFKVARKERDIAKFALDTLTKQKRAALENTVELFRMEYFSTPRERNLGIDPGKRILERKKENEERIDNAKRIAKRRSRKSNNKN